MKEIPNDEERRGTCAASRKEFSEWNQYRKRHPDWIPDLRGVDLSNIDLAPDSQRVADLSKADLRSAKLPGVAGLSVGGISVSFDGALIDIDTTGANGFDLLRHGAIFLTESESSRYRPHSPPRVFVSYAWANEDVILAIDQWLRLKGIGTRLDKRDFFAGARIRDEIVRVMKDCDTILVFHSQESKDKPWPQFERELAADLEMEAKQESKQSLRIIYIVRSYAVAIRVYRG